MSKQRRKRNETEAQINWRHKKNIKSTFPWDHQEVLYFYHLFHIPLADVATNDHSKIEKMKKSNAHERKSWSHFSFCPLIIPTCTAPFIIYLSTFIFFHPMFKSSSPTKKLLSAALSSGYQQKKLIISHSTIEVTKRAWELKGEKEENQGSSMCFFLFLFLCSTPWMTSILLFPHYFPTTQQSTHYHLFLHTYKYTYKTIY
jgi:hypothetical protein